MGLGAKESGSPCGGADVCRAGMATSFQPVCFQGLNSLIPTESFSPCAPILVWMSTYLWFTFKSSFFLRGFKFGRISAGRKVTSLKVEFVCLCVCVCVCVCVY